MPTITGDTGYAVAEAFGADGVLARALVGSVGYTPAGTFGGTGTAFVGSTAGIKVFIAGVDRTSYVAVDSVQVTDPLSGTGSCSFLLKDRTNAWRPVLGSEVLVFRDATRIFGGNLATKKERYESETCTFVSCTCHDFNAILDRRILARHYTIAQGGIVNVTIHDMCLRLADEGITFAGGTSDPGISLGEQTFNYVTYAEAFKQVLSKANWDYKVDWWKNVYIFAAGTGRGAAPIDITDANHSQWGGMEVEDTIARYANRVYVRNSQNMSATQVDSFTAAAGALVFETSYILTAAPVITVGGVEQTVVEYADIQTTPYDFYYINGGIGIFKHQGSPCTGGEVIEATYPSALSYVYQAQDDAEITARAAADGGSGLYEIVEEVKDVPGKDEMGYYGDGMLARRSTVARTVSFNTLVDGFYAGQTLTINTTTPLVSSGTYTIQEVRTQDRAKDFFYSVKATSDATLPKASAQSFFNQMIYRDKQPLDRIIERIVFVLAETIEGIDNPGLSVGLKPPSRVAAKSGVCRECVIYFPAGSPDSISTEIQVDVFKNGTSIFPDGGPYATWPVGATNPRITFRFSGDPLKVAKGDVFTFEVLQADAGAKDGYLELSVWG